MKRFILYISILFLGLAYVTNAQTTVSLPDTNVAVGPTTLNIPMMVQNFNNVGAVSIRVSYDPAVLTFQGIANGAVANITANATNGVISIGWFSPDGVTPINISNGKLLDLKFGYTNGTSNLNFITTNGQSEIATLTSTVIPTTFDNGSIMSPVRVSLDHVKASPGDTVRVPLRGFNLTNVGAISLKIGYDTSVLQFLGVANDSVHFTSVSASNGVLTMGWFSNNNVPFNMADGVMADIVFKYTDNSSALQFITINGQSEISDINNNIINAQFINGSVAKDRSVSLPTLQSVPNVDVSFPLTVKNLSVGSASIDILFNPAVLTFKQITNSTGDVTAANVISPGRLRIGYAKGQPTFSTGNLFDIVFTYAGGTGVLDFDETQTSFTDELGAVYSGFDYINGNISQINPPVFTSELPDTTINENQALTFDYNATDVDGDVLRYSLLTSPVGSSIDSVTGVFSWTPSFTQAGTHQVVVVVTDTKGLKDTSRTSIVTILNVNRPPVFTAEMADDTLAEGETLTFTYTATDPDGQALKFYLVNPPSGAVIDSLTGVFTWTPNFSQSGSYNIVAVVSDGSLTDTSRTTILLVTNVNRPPVFTAEMPDTTIKEAKTLNFQYLATDPDGQALKYSLVAAPAGAVIDSLTGLFAWTPAFTQAGTYNIVAVVSDGSLTDTSRTSVVVVTDSNRAPIFTAEMPDTTIKETKTLNFQYLATDPDGQVLKYSLISAPTGAVIDSLTGLFTWTPSFTQAGSYNIVAVVSDGSLKDTSRTSVVVVTDSNRAPIFTAEMPDTTIKETKTLSFQYLATDPDGQALKYSLISAPAGAVIDSLTGLFAWTPSFTQAGSYNIVAVVSDGSLKDTSRTSVVVVTDSNRAPIFTAEMPDTSIREMKTLNFQYLATDPDGQALKYSLVAAPAGAVIDTLTGLFAWTPAFTQAGSYNIVAVVSDGSLTDTSRTSVVVVTDSNRAPIFTAEMPDTSIQETKTLNFQYTATDPDGQALKFKLVTPPTGARIDSLTGLFAWTPSFTQAGTYNVIAVVSDGALTDTSRTSIVVVTDSTRPPVFTAVMIDGTEINENEKLSFNYAATDPDAGDSLRFAIASAPAGAAINPVTGLFEWTPTYSQAGTYNIVVSVTDGKYTVKDTATGIIVHNVNRPPAFTSVMGDVESMKLRDTITFQYTASDPDGNSNLRFALVNAPAGATINVITGFFRYIAQDVGPKTIIVSVTDQIVTVFDTALVKMVVKLKREEGIPTEYKLTQNFPNPFNPSTKIEFSVPQESQVTLKIYNLLGEVVATLVNDLLPAANYEYNFNASNLSSGIYIYRLEAGTYISTKKMTLLK